MKKNAPNLSAWVAPVTYPINIKTATEQLKVIGAKLDNALNTHIFASLMPEFKVPEFSPHRYQPAIFNV